MPSKLDYFTLGSDQIVAWLVQTLIDSDATLLAHTLVLLARFQHRHHAVQGEAAAPKFNPAAPQGPFTVSRPNQRGDLLIFVPRSLESYLIDEATGRYGYSHVAVDCGEIDQSTGQAVMTEATMHNVVHRSFQDNYGARPFVRVPLSRAGVDATSLCDCVLSRLGEPYDSVEALTWGEVDDPAKQICTGLAADCLTSKMREAIARAGRAGKLGRHAVSAHRRAGRLVEMFVSPNAFAEFFGAPPGREIEKPDELVLPQRGADHPAVSRVWLFLLGALGVAGGLLIFWWLGRPRGGER